MNQLHKMKDEAWEGLCLIVLGAIVLAFCFLDGQIGGAFLVEHRVGEWPGIIFILATAVLGIYSLVLIHRGRIFPAFLGLVIFAIGALFNLPILPIAHLFVQILFRQRWHIPWDKNAAN